MALWEMDTTHFSAVQYYFRQTTEALLHSSASANFPLIKQIDIQVFREIYGALALVCRHLHCKRSADGFGSPSQRDKHELKEHQNKFRCIQASCVYFTTFCD